MLRLLSVAAFGYGFYRLLHTRSTHLDLENGVALGLIGLAVLLEFLRSE